ncbi:MAG: NUDIX domain-containing protein [Bacteroidales bacterium]
MHTVYYERKKLVFLSTGERLPLGITLKIPSGEQDELWELFTDWATNPGMQNMGLVGRDPARLFRQLASMLPIVEAAGGVVENLEKQILFIFRKGMWDLPKGKIDPGEKPEEAAIREVGEECGISGLEIGGNLPTTYHVYQLSKGDWVLKKTYWFKMTAIGNQQPTPQQLEDITLAEWIPPSRVKHLVAKSYQSIAEVVREYMFLYT